MRFSSKPCKKEVTKPLLHLTEIERRLKKAKKNKKIDFNWLFILLQKVSEKSV